MMNSGVMGIDEGMGRIEGERGDFVYLMKL